MIEFSYVWYVVKDCREREWFAGRKSWDNALVFICLFPFNGHYRSPFPGMESKDCFNVSLLHPHFSLLDNVID